MFQDKFIERFSQSLLYKTSLVDSFIKVFFWGFNLLIDISPKQPKVNDKSGVRGAWCRLLVLRGVVGAAGGELVQQLCQRARGAARHAARLQVRHGAPLRHLAHARDVHVHPVAAHEVLQPYRYLCPVNIIIFIIIPYPTYPTKTANKSKCPK